MDVSALALRVRDEFVKIGRNNGSIFGGVQ
jgi:hypothetical protein